MDRETSSLMSPWEMWLPSTQHILLKHSTLIYPFTILQPTSQKKRKMSNIDHSKFFIFTKRVKS